MADFAALNARLTAATKNRLGEPVTFVSPDGAEKAVQAVIDRNTEIVGQNGQLSDLRTAASLAIADVGRDVDGGRIKTAAGEDLYIDGKLEDDGQYVRVALR